MTVKLGLIGYGTIAQQVYTPLLASSRDAEVVAVCDQDGHLLAKATEAFPAASGYSNYHDLLQADDVQAVLISLPTHLHAAASIACLEQRKHFYLEKPMTSSLNEAQTVLDSWRALGPNKVIAMLGLNFRRESLIQNLRTQIHMGKIGKIQYVHSVNSRHFPEIPVWKQRRETGGGALLDLGSHHLDLWEELFGSPLTHVGASIDNIHSEQDRSVVEAVNRTGIHFRGYFSFRSVPSNRFEVYGENGKLSIDLIGSSIVETESSNPRFVRLRKLWEATRSAFNLPDFLENRRAPWCTPSYKKALDVFVEACHSGRPVRPDLLDGFRVAQLMDAVEAAASSGRTFAVSTSEANYE